ncbi:MAG: AbrB/MazE/SpoVT family DNA-binding domain-containing protein [Opitutales bacterium]|nr:AbrB/MazE/SpoVT family DNA-binding domain-containing protein [Opitutales bacterium]MCH8541855.1 AbrB/MazE/SpoVT family DNA-binding domain-containing protein [Opitutales bacterium]
MKTSLIRIGNSRGIRLPKPLIEQCGFGDEVDLEVKGQQLVIRPLECTRSGWEEAFAEMAKHGDDKLSDREGMSTSTWDEEEWEW